jgi:hypothetical protein
MKKYLARVSVKELYGGLAYIAVGERDPRTEFEVQNGRMVQSEP